jgi:TonB family protein
MRHLVIICMLLNFGPAMPPSQKGRAAQTGIEGTADEPVYASKDVDRKAVITERIEPGYTEEAQTRGIEGVVLLSVLLSASGRVTDVEVLNGLPDGLTKRAVDAARKVKFVPALKGGGPVAVRVKLAYYFALPGRSFYGDSSKKTYYRYGCHRSIGPNDFVVFKSKKEAEKSGYKRADCP